MNPHSPVCSVAAMGGRTLTYLLDDRVEVGRMNLVFIEELERMSYRDVETVTTWRTVRVGRLIGGGLFAILALVLLITLPSGFVGIPIILAVCAIVLLISGRPGALLHLQIDDGLRSVRTVVGGTEKKKLRILEQLVSRVEAAR